MNTISEERQKFDFRKSIGGVIISVLVASGIILLVAGGDFRELARGLVKADHFLIIFAVGLYFLEVGFWTGRWKVALDSVGHGIKFSGLYLICHGGKFVTNVTPILKAGGDPFRAYFANKTHDLPYDIGFGTLLAETAVSVPVFFSFLTLGFFLWLYINANIWMAISAGLLLGLFSIFFIPLVRWLVGRETAMNQIVRLIHWFSEKIGREDDIESTTKSLKKFYKSTNFLMGHRRATFYMVLLSVMLYLTTIFRFHIIFLALGVHVQWYVPLLGATVPFLLGLIPFSPGGLVFVEGGMIGLFVALGIPEATSSLIVVVERGISFFVSTLAGAIAASYLGLKIWKD